MKVKIEFDHEKLEKLDIKGTFVVNGKLFSRLTLAGLKKAIAGGTV